MDRDAADEHSDGFTNGWQLVPDEAMMRPVAACRPTGGLRADLIEWRRPAGPPPAIDSCSGAIISALLAPRSKHEERRKEQRRPMMCVVGIGDDTEILLPIVAVRSLHRLRRDHPDQNSETKTLTQIVRKKKTGRALKMLAVTWLALCKW